MTGYEKIYNQMVTINPNLIGDYIVEILIDNSLITEIVSISPDYCTWLNDWWEGEKNISLIDFIKLEDVHFYGECQNKYKIFNK